MLQYLIGSSDSKSGQEESERDNKSSMSGGHLRIPSVESVRHVEHKSDINTNDCSVLKAHEPNVRTACPYTSPWPCCSVSNNTQIGQFRMNVEADPLLHVDTNVPSTKNSPWARLAARVKW